MEKFKMIVRYKDGMTREYLLGDIWLPHIVKTKEVDDIEIEKI